jgi:hypothetical protein
MNVISFPQGRPVPPKATADALLEELAGLDVKLARARLTQIQSETRQASALFAWWWAKRLVCCALVLWLVSTCAKAESKAVDILPSARPAAVRA